MRVQLQQLSEVTKLMGDGAVELIRGEEPDRRAASIEW